ncbi:MAG: hypothetical protein P4L85_09965 [Paludisphaera borealis]|uniref:hypothetical protein n=1 Tax=Paludisphaera borealis TaxID=1387353 RepID=UPI002846C9A8|nr:hypothetical protein [Paludisphaera borealis]MDR3619665.1 hypothetical protein [Paludisphaera borealis]
MTLDELDRTLPNGFHDAEVTSVRIDYVRREVEMVLDLWVGDLSSGEEDVREAYRSATLTLSGLQYCCIEPPDSQYPYRESRPITVDAVTVESLRTPPETRLPAATPDVGFTHCFFVYQWNSYIYVSAQAASLAWHPEPR